MIIAIGSDHAGFTYKEKIKEFLSALGIRSRTSVHIPKSLSITRSLSVRSLKQWRVARLSAASYSAAQAMAKRWLPTASKESVARSAGMWKQHDWHGSTMMRISSHLASG